MCLNQRIEIRSCEDLDRYAKHSLKSLAKRLHTARLENRPAGSDNADAECSEFLPPAWIAIPGL